MSNAAKHRKKAAEFEQLKQIDRAIASYIKAIEESESAGEDVDVALFNKVGDLALRQGRVPDAITYYERAVEHYATSGLFNNAIALCNKILRSAPGRANVYFTLGRICARKGLRGDATKNFLEYATRMREEGKTEEGMRALAEIVDLSPELIEVRKLVDEYAGRAGIALPRRITPPIVAVVADGAEQKPSFRDQKSADLVFIHLDYGKGQPAPSSEHVRTPAPAANAVRTPTPPAVDKLAAAIIEPGPGFEVARINVTPIALAPIVELPASAPSDAGAEHQDASAPVTDLVPTAALRPDDVLADPMGIVPLDGLEANGSFDGIGVVSLDGLTLEETPAAVLDAVLPPVDGLSLAPHELETQTFAQVIRLPDAELEDFEHAADNPVVARLIYTETPPSTAAVELPMLMVDPTPLNVEAISDVSDVAATGLGSTEALDLHALPELDAAIAAGTETAAYDESEAITFRLTPLDAAPVQPARMTPLMIELDLDAIEEHAPPTRPPFRIDPHDFILPGELPPLLLDDAIVDAGLAGETVSSRHASRPLTPVSLTPVSLTPVSLTPVTGSALPGVESADRNGAEQYSPVPVEADDLLDVGEELAALTSVTPAAGSAAPDSAAAFPPASPAVASIVDEPRAGPQEMGAALVEPARSDDASTVHALDAVGAASGDETVEDTESVAADESHDAVGDLSTSTLRPTPSLPIAAVAAEAAIVATSRRDALRSAVARLPKNWLLRRRLAEALFESGDTDEALVELETARLGLIEEGELSAAADIGEELVQVSPDRIAFHQRRVELSVRMHDLQRLRLAYLDLADALVRQGEESRARAVYARVLEIDPLDDRARAALGAAAPPPPPPAARPDDDFVDLSTWLKEEEGGTAATTRLRMREPVISGNEQADFDELLRHFKEGVARSLGEDDFESHYDLGVAYKEMGLLDDAIAEFQKALRSRGNRLPAYEALGQCFVEQRRHQVAATVLSRALHEPGLGDEQRVGVLYLLAFSYEALQRYDEARSYYQRVYATDIHFRDVAARLAALELVAR